MQLKSAKFSSTSKFVDVIKVKFWHVSLNDRKHSEFVIEVGSWVGSSKQVKFVPGKSVSCCSWMKCLAMRGAMNAPKAQLK